MIITEAHLEKIFDHADELGEDFLASLGLRPGRCQFPTGLCPVVPADTLRQTVAVWHSYGGSAGCLRPMLCRGCYEAMDGDMPTAQMDDHSDCPDADGECVAGTSVDCISDTCNYCRNW